MSKQIEKIRSSDVTSIADQDFTPEQYKIITNVIAKDATKNELSIFLYQCKSLGLDPFKKQIYFVKYGGKPGVAIVSIDGFRSKALRTKELTSSNRGVLKDKEGKLIGGWAEVRRKGWEIPTREEVPFSEYDTGRNNWVKMPETMIKKVAEAAALRIAFPDELGGVYISEEMDQADDSPNRIVPDQPTAGDGIQYEGYHCPGHLDHRVANKPISQCDPALLREIVENIEAKYEGKKIPKAGQTFIGEAEVVIGNFENSISFDEAGDE